MATNASESSWKSLRLMIPTARAEPPQDIDYALRFRRCSEAEGGPMRGETGRGSCVLFVCFFGYHV